VSDYFYSLGWILEQEAFRRPPAGIYWIASWLAREDNL